MIKRYRVGALLAGLLSTLLIAACGGGAPTSSTPPPRSTPSAKPTAPATPLPTNPPTAAPSAPALTGFGATLAQWKAHHRPATTPGLAANCCWNPDPNLPQVNGHIGYRYYAVNWIDGRAMNYEIAEYNGTSITQAQADTISGEFPNDVTVVWDVTSKDTCAQMELRSATLANADPPGQALIEFTSGENGDTYDPGSITGVIITLDDSASAASAPGC